jgi:uncharacterized membrane protein YciS (DUF1049 family)
MSQTSEEAPSGGFAPPADGGVRPPLRDCETQAPEPVGRWVLAGVFSTALGTLLAELALTRLFSVILFYHFAFMAISVALLGLGAGGLCSYFLAGWLERGGVWPRLAPIAAANAVVTILALAVILRQSIPLLFSAGTIGKLAVAYFAATAPFFLCGMVLAVVLARTARQAGTVYFADLGGASAGCLLLIPLLEWLGAPNTILAAAGLWGLSAAFWSAAGRRPGWKRWLLVPLALAAVIAINARSGLLDVRYAKGRPTGNEVFARWNSFSRVGMHRTHNGEYWIQIDADAATQVADAPADPSPKWTEQLRDYTAGLVYRLRRPDRVLVIGPGGGVDVARALAAGARHVTGVEINPIIVNNIMRGRMRANSFGLYDRPDVDIEIEDGRSFIRRSTAQYDVIQATLVDTWASTSSGAYALTENNLYTVEAFQEYLRHLTQDGMLSVTRWEFRRPREALRLVSLGLEALRLEGAHSPGDHFAVIADNELGDTGTATTVLIKRTPFTREQAEEVARAVATGSKEARLLAAPGLHLPNAFCELLNTPNPDAFYAGYPFDIRPVTDNRPFFFFNMRTADVVMRAMGINLSLIPKGAMDLKVNLGFALLLAVLVFSGFAVAAFLVAPAYLIRRLPAGGGVRRYLFFFVGIGLAYILAEIAFIQKFVLFLGHPTYALAVAVLALLLSSALGSRYSQQWTEEELASQARNWLTVAAALLIAIGVGIAPLVTPLVWLPLGARMLLAAALLAAPGFLMGTAFPSGLRLLRLSHPAALEWAWAMNAAASVLGSALAIFISIHFGIWQTMAAAALCYLAAASLLTPPAAPVLRPVRVRDFAAQPAR